MKRAGGILLHVTSLPSPFGLGDLGPEAYRFVEFLAAAGQSYWQVLPLTPTHAGMGHSPYFSASVFAGNPLLVSLDLLHEQGFVTAAELDASRIGCDGTARYDAAAERKIPFLRTCAERMKSDETVMREFHSFCEKESAWLDDFALFMVLKQDRDDSSWNTWPEPLARREPRALEELARREEQRVWREKFAQYLFFRQWQALQSTCSDRGISIIGDIPIYTAYESADVWANQELFKLNENLECTAVSGVPPDYFSETGQLWNTPVYSWEALRRSGYAWWVSRMRAMLERFDMVRVDHFRGLVQYWEVPAGSTTAIDGTWVPVPAYDFFDTLRDTLPRFPLVAEDLGTITPDVREVMAHYGFPGMKVLLFAFNEDNPDNPYLPHNYERNCIAYTGTHDNNTARGWFAEEAGGGAAGRLSRYAGETVREETAARELIRLAMMSVADTAIIPMQDVLNLGSPARMNLPASTEGNWLWRMGSADINDAAAEKLRSLSETYGRVRKT